LQLRFHMLRLEAASAEIQRMVTWDLPYNQFNQRYPAQRRHHGTN
jgi:hypothetical protein